MFSLSHTTVYWWFVLFGVWWWFFFHIFLSDGSSGKFCCETQTANLTPKYNKKTLFDFWHNKILFHLFIPHIILLFDTHIYSSPLGLFCLFVRCFICSKQMAEQVLLTLLWKEKHARVQLQLDSLKNNTQRISLGDLAAANTTFCERIVLLIFDNLQLNSSLCPEMCQPETILFQRQ